MTRNDMIKQVLFNEKQQRGIKVSIYLSDFITLSKLSSKAAEVLERMIKLTPRTVVDATDYFVEYSYKDFEFIAKPNFYRARKELEDSGFIVLHGKAFYVRHDMVNHTRFKQYQLLMKNFAVGPDYGNNVPNPFKRK
jgi:hypothetical protein